MNRKRTNWHEAAVCAIQITLRDFEHLLEYLTEYPLGGNAYRIDLLVIRKLQDHPIPHSIAHIFRSYNLWEVKGIHSSITIPSYYKTIGYASMLIAANDKAPPHDRRDISLSFLCSRYPRKLFAHFTECKKPVANPSPGVYYISEDIYPVQVIVTGQLPPKEALYLRCLTDKLTDSGLAEQLAEDYSLHLEQPAYQKYMNQLTNANLRAKGDEPMAICCEGIFRLYGTSYKEVAEKAAREAVAPVQKQLEATAAQLDNATKKLDSTTKELNNKSKELDSTTKELNNTSKELSNKSKELDSTSRELCDSRDEIAYLKKLLDEHGITYT